MGLTWGGDNVPENALRRRVQFSPFWKVTRWGCALRYVGGPILWPNRGCDEWHNKSHFVIIPLVGMFVLFRKEGFDRSGTEHLYGMTGGKHPEYHGRIVEGCEICDEILEEFAT